MGLRPPMVMKTAPVFWKRLSLVIPTGAQRSGGTCGSAALSWECFSTEESWAFGPPKVMKNGSCFLEAPPLPLVIPSAAQWRDLRFGGTFLGMFSTEESWAFGPPKVMKNGFCSATTVDGGTALPFIISTEAYPDFLRRAAGNGHMCGSP